MQEGFTPSQEDLLWQAFLKGDPETRSEHIEKLLEFVEPKKNGGKVSEKAVQYMLKLIFEPPFRYTYRDGIITSFVITDLWEKIPPYKGSLKFIDDVFARGHHRAKGRAAAIVEDMLLYRYIPTLENIVEDYADSEDYNNQYGLFHGEGAAMAYLEGGLEVLKAAQMLGAPEGSGLTPELRKQVARIFREEAKRAREQVERLLGM